MPPLSNPKHEEFAKKVISERSASKAYRLVYGAKVAGAEASASRLLKSANVAARLAELGEKAEKSTVMGLKEMFKWLESAINTPIANVDENSPLAQAVEYDITGKTRRRLKITMPNKLRAMELYAKLAGLMREDIVRHTGTVNVEHRAIVVTIPAAIAAPRKAKEASPHLPADS